MYHIVYLTTNLVNGKIYVGVHHNSTDSYIGSGKILAKAIKKYGKQNFKRQILHSCLEASHAYELEAQIVDQWFVDRKDTYNMCIGGSGGNRVNYNDPEVYAIWLAKNNAYARTNSPETRKLISQSKKELYKDPTKNPNYGKKASDEKRKRQSDGIKEFYKSDENRKQMYINLKRARQKNYQIITPNAIIPFTNLNDIMDWCRSQGFAWQSLYKSLTLNRKLMSGKMKDYQLLVLPTEVPS
jgi:hypothetical protein